MRKPDDSEWSEVLSELDKLLSELHNLHGWARWRARQPILDGYPTQSMPESTIQGGRAGDPTGRHVEIMAGGKEDEPDRWLGPADPIKKEVMTMISQTVKARDYLRGSVAAMKRSLPTNIPEKGRECCRACGVPKAIVTVYGQKPHQWVTNLALCRADAERQKRHPSMGTHARRA